MTNRIIVNGQFHAIVNGKPTALAGCARVSECARATACLRADARLPYRANLAPHQSTTDCRAFILGA